MEDRRIARESGPRCLGLSVLRLKYGESVTPSPGLMPLSDRSDSDANHRNLESCWSAEFSAVWAYIPSLQQITDAGQIQASGAVVLKVGLGQDSRPPTYIR
jgi:hypothetical protein